MRSVSEEGFLSGKTGWEAELVCEHKVPVVRKECIGNLLSFLTQAAAEGKCVFHTYSEDRQYQSMLQEELGERIKFLGLSSAEIKKDPRLKSFIDLRG